MDASKLAFARTGANDRRGIYLVFSKSNAGQLFLHHGCVSMKYAYHIMCEF